MPAPHRWGWLLIRRRILRGWRQLIMRKSSGFSTYLGPACISIAMHGALAAILLLGIVSTEKPERNVRPNYVPAKLVELKPQSVKKPAAQKPKPQKIDLTKQRREQERQKKLAEQKRAEQARQKREQEKAAAEKARKQREQKERERLAAEKAAAEKKAAAEREAQMRREREQAMADELAEEANRIAAQEQAQEAQSYIAVIAQRIEQNWSRPPSARNGMKCELLMQLVPTGRVVSVSVVKSSGNSAFDRSAEQAVKKIEQFSEVKDMPPEVFERYFRQLRLEFNPQDLRL